MDVGILSGSISLKENKAAPYRWF